MPSSPEHLLRNGFPQLELLVRRGKRNELDPSELALLSLALSGALDTLLSCQGTFGRLYRIKLRRLMEELEPQGASMQGSI